MARYGWSHCDHIVVDILLIECRSCNLKLRQENWSMKVPQESLTSLQFQRGSVQRSRTHRNCSLQMFFKVQWWMNVHEGIWTCSLLQVTILKAHIFELHRFSHIKLAQWAEYQESLTTSVSILSFSANRSGYSVFEITNIYRAATNSSDWSVDVLRRTGTKRKISNPK